MNIEDFNKKRREEIKRANEPHKIGVECSCGGDMLLQPGRMLCSWPPRMVVICDKCGKTDYIIA